MGRLIEYLDKNHHDETTAEALRVSSALKHVNLVGISGGHVDRCLNRIWDNLADIAIFDIGTNDIDTGKFLLVKVTEFVHHGLNLNNTRVSPLFTAQCCIDFHRRLWSVTSMIQF